MVQQHSSGRKGYVDSVQWMLQVSLNDHYTYLFIIFETDKSINSDLHDY